MTAFDELCNDLLFEIFDYLPFEEVFYAFFGLQKRLDGLIRTYPASIHLTKALHQSLLTNGPFHCRSLVVKNISLQCSKKPESDCTFHGTKSVEFSHTDCNTILSIFNQMSMEQLESIIIKFLDWEYKAGDIQREVWSMIAVAGSKKLRYLDVPLQTIYEGAKQLSSDLSSLESAIFSNVSDEKMFVFLHHTPNLCSFTARIHEFYSDVDLSGLNILKLTCLNLRLENHGSFESLYHFLNRCSNLIDFKFRCWSTKVDWKMTDPDHWQKLIERCLPQLLYLDVRFYRYIPIDSDPTIENQFDNSNYWRNRQPNFSITRMDV